MDRGSAPSPLDAPRFFDDPPLSAWSVGNRRFAAPKNIKNIEAKSLAYSAAGNAPRLPPAHRTDPISIEIVRGANGPRDEGWTVLVDGIRCRRLDPILQDGATGFRCVLPPGVPLPDPSEKGTVKLTSGTRVRPVVVGIRLEEEALMPENATLVVEQVLDTSERLDQDADKPEVKRIKKVALKPYRVSDIQSNAAVLQYPFHSPSQSVLGILSLNALSRWEEDHLLSVAWLAAAPALNMVIQSTYDNSIANRKALMTTRFSSLTVPASQQALTEFLLPKKPKKIGLGKVRVAPEAGVADSLRIGGGSDSSARALGDLFAVLAQACNDTSDVNDSLNGKLRMKDSKRVQKHLLVMELALSANGDKKALALLRALCTADIKPEIKELLRPALYKSKANGVDRSNLDPSFEFRYRFNGTEDLQDFNDITETTRGVAAGSALDSDARKQVYDSIATSYTTSVANLKAPYVFTYERLLLPIREETTVYTRFRVVIEQEEGKDPFSVEFVAERQDGFVANSVYSGELKDIEHMDMQAERFMKCLFGPYTGGPRHIPHDAADVQLADKRKRSSSSQLKAAYLELSRTTIKSLIGNNSVTNVAEIETRINELRIMVREMLPVWPPPNPQDVTQVEQDTNDIVEGLVQAAKDAFEDESYQEGEGGGPTSVELGGEPRSGSSTASVRVAGESRMRSFTAPVGAGTDWDWAFYGFAEDELAYEAEPLRKQQQELFDAQIRAIEKADKEDDNSKVYRAGLLSHVLVRRLPQIVKPNTTIVFRFEVPESVQPPDMYLIFDKDKPSSTWSSYLPSWRGALIGAGGAFAMSAVMFTAVNTLALNFFIYGQGAAQAAAEAGYAMVFQPISIQNLFKAAQSVSLAIQAKEVATYLSSMRLVERVVGIESQIASFTFHTYRERIAGNYALQQASDEHFRKERGTPVRDAFAAARKAVSAWQYREEARLADTKDASVVYNPLNGKRFHFLECFAITGKAVKAYKPLYGAEHWSVASAVNVFCIIPPSDVDKAYVQTQAFRGLPLEQTVSFVTGSSYSYFLPSAKAAFRELMSSLEPYLRIMHNGQRIERSAQRLAVELVQQGALLMKAVYGKASGVTLVGPDDILWSCLHASTFARLALRHLALFADSPSASGKPEFVKECMDFWKFHRRDAVDQFADALVVEAREFAIPGAARRPSLTVEDSRVEEIRRYDRVRALLTAHEVSSSVFSSIMKVVNSSRTAFAMPVPESRACDQDALLQEHNTTVHVSNTPPDFGYQSVVDAPVMQRFTGGEIWASRRVDTALSRAMCIGKGAGSVIESLSSLQLGVRTSLKPSRFSHIISKLTVCVCSSIRVFSGFVHLYCGQGTHDGEMVFYCPSGSRLNYLPCSAPFDYKGMDSRVVWLYALREAAEDTICNIQDAKLPPESWQIDAVPLHKSDGVVGIGRHPATVVVNANRISVKLSSQTGEGGYAEQVCLMRRKAYNTDRLFFALSLAYSNAQQAELCISVPHEDIVCLAIARAMRRIAGGAPPVGHKVYVDDVNSAYELMNKLVAQVKAAEGAGCRFVSLAEASLCA